MPFRMVGVTQGSGRTDNAGYFCTTGLGHKEHISLEVPRELRTTLKRRCDLILRYRERGIASWPAAIVEFSIVTMCSRWQFNFHTRPRTFVPRYDIIDVLTRVAALLNMENIQDQFVPINTSKCLSDFSYQRLCNFLLFALNYSGENGRSRWLLQLSQTKKFM